MYRKKVFSSSSNDRESFIVKNMFQHFHFDVLNPFDAVCKHHHKNEAKEDDEEVYSMNLLFRIDWENLRND